MDEIITFEQRIEEQKKASKRSAEISKWLTVALFFGPYLFFFVLFFVYPLIQGIVDNASGNVVGTAAYYRHVASHQCLVCHRTDQAVIVKTVRLLKCLNGCLCCRTEITVSNNIITLAGKRRLNFRNLIALVAQTEGRSAGNGSCTD